MLNNFSGAGAKVLTQTDLNAVSAADTIGLTLSVNQGNPQPSDLLYFDDINGSITGTIIPEVAANDASNKVVIINRGTGGGIAHAPGLKIMVLRKYIWWVHATVSALQQHLQTLNPRAETYHFLLFF